MKTDKELWDFENIKQSHTSSITSINAIKMPTTIKVVKEWIKPGQRWADIGGGKYDNVINFFKEQSAELFVYDPFNRTREENELAVKNIADAKCDGVMVNNVLNVIEDKENRAKVIKQAFDCLKGDGWAFFKIYEGNKSGVKSLVKNKSGSSIQLNQKTDFFLSEIREVFGEKVVKKSELIFVRKEVGLSLALSGLKKSAKNLGVPERSKKLGVGKVVGEDLYVHKDYASVFDAKSFQAALSILKNNVLDFDFTIIKYNKKNGKYSFVNVPDFDSSHEPIVGNTVVVNVDGTVDFLKQKKDPQIYHHKWNFVRDDYSGFSVKGSIERSIKWKSLVGVNKEVSSRIGYKSFWENLEKNGFITDNGFKKNSKSL